MLKFSSLESWVVFCLPTFLLIPYYHLCVTSYRYDVMSFSYWLGYSKRTWKFSNQVLVVRGSLVVEVMRGAGLPFQIDIWKGVVIFLKLPRPYEIFENSLKNDSIRVTNPRLLIFHCRLGEVLLCYAVPCRIIAPTPETTSKIAKRPDSSKSNVSRKRKTRRRQKISALD